MLPKFRPLFIPIALSSFLTLGCSSVPSDGQAPFGRENQPPSTQGVPDQLPPAPAKRNAGIQISPTEASSIGQRIWKNECAGTVAGLTSWNAGENFASLGIGHFIWFPVGVRAPYEESFPPLIAFMKAKGARMPAWLASTPDCPWKSKAQFESAAVSAQMTELRAFLKNTIPLQVEFILQRLDGALPKMLAAVPASQRQQVEQRFYAVASTAQGKYALMDYVNFKGEGTNPSERYNGQGWGMLRFSRK